MVNFPCRLDTCRLTQGRNLNEKLSRLASKQVCDGLFLIGLAEVGKPTVHVNGPIS